MFTTGGRKKFCDYCKILVPWDEFKDHERTKQHRRKKETELEWQQSKTRRDKAKVAQEQSNKGSKILNDLENKAFKAQENYDRVNNPHLFAQGGDQKHTQKNREGEEIKLNEENFQALDAPIRSDYNMGKFGYSGNGIGRGIGGDGVDFQGSEMLKKQFKEVWTLIKDEEKGRICFLNRITGEKKYERPFGLKLTDEEQQRWDRDQQLKELGKEYNSHDSDEISVHESDEQFGIIQGEWESVDNEEDFFNKNKASPNRSSRSSSQDPMRRIGQQIDDGELKEDREIIDQMIEELSKNQVGVTNKTRFKNEQLKKLIDHNIELPANLKKPTFKHDTDQLEQLNNVQQDKIGQKKQELSKPVFKKRMMNNKKSIKIGINEETEDDKY